MIQEQSQALTDWSDDDDFLGQEMEDDFSMLPREESKQAKYIDVLKNILPHLGSDETKIVITEVMIALKLEGTIGKQLSGRETQMVHTLKDAILAEPIRRRQAISLAQKLISSGQDSE